MSLTEKLADLDGELKVLVDALGGIISDDATNSQKISLLETDSKLHGQLILQVLVKTNDHWQRLLLVAPALGHYRKQVALTVTGRRIATTMISVNENRKRTANRSQYLFRRVSTARHSSYMIRL